MEQLTSLDGLKEGDIVQHDISLKLFRVTGVDEGYVSVEPVLHPDDLDEYSLVYQKKGRGRHEGPRGERGERGEQGPPGPAASAPVSAPVRGTAPSLPPEKK